MGFPRSVPRFGWKRRRPDANEPAAGSMDPSKNEAESLLCAYLTAPDESLGASCLNALTRRYLEPTVRRVVRRHFGYDAEGGAWGRRAQEDAEDVARDALSSVLTHLDHCRRDPSRERPRDVLAYTAATAEHAFASYLRRTHPAMGSLIRRLRHLLASDPAFATWFDGETLCGVTGWRGLPATRKSLVRIKAIATDPASFLGSSLNGDDPQGLDLVTLVHHIFDWVQDPIPLAHLFPAMAKLWSIEDETVVSLDDERHNLSEVASPAPDPQHAAIEKVDLQEHLRELWNEIGQLPPGQCGALLLNLRATGDLSGIEIFELTGIATLEEMAAAMGVTGEDLARVYFDLPLKDVVVAGILHVSVKNVTSMRFDAREKLRKRLSLSRDFPS
ncbi:MAG TPA: hypothetical protein VGM37_03355 [Armatimonadota bacterium]|jgi:hypothetical protein